MASASSSTVATIPSSTSQNRITINATAQLPLKLTKLNYFSWKGQFNALFFGLDLLGYLDGTLTCPPPLLTKDDKTVPNPDHLPWRRQDQLILHAILASLSEPVIPLVSSAASSHEAWTRLSRLYAKRSTTHMIHLKDKLTTITRGSLYVTDFLTSIKQIADELTALVGPPGDANLLVYATRGLGPTYKELITALRTRDTVVPFEELSDKIIDHETFLIHNDKQHSEPEPPTANLTKHSHSYQKPFKSRIPPPTRPLLPTPPFPPTPSHTPKHNQPHGQNSTAHPIVCQYCTKPGHTANRCFKLFPHLRPQRPSANHAALPPSSQNQWIVDSGASHHVTSQLSNFSHHQPYEGPDDIHIGDGSGFTYRDSSTSGKELA